MALPENVHAWNEEHVCAWLVSVHPDFKVYRKKFRENGITGSDLLSLDKTDLKKRIRITGHKRSSKDRETIVLAIDKLNKRQNVEKNLTRPVMEWDSEHVGIWLDKIGLPHLRSQLVKMGVTGSELMNCEMNMMSIKKEFQIEDGRDGAIFFRSLRGLKSSSSSALTPNTKSSLSLTGSGLLRLGLEGGGEPSLNLSRLGSSVSRSESKLSESWLNRSNSRAGIGRSDSNVSRSGIGRSDSNVSRSGIGRSDSNVSRSDFVISRSDSAISTRSGSSIRRGDSGLPSITPRSAGALSSPQSRSRFFVPDIDFARINGDDGDDLEDTDEELYAKPPPIMKTPSKPSSRGKFSNLKLGNMNESTDDEDEFADYGKDRGRAKEATPLDKTQYSFSRTGTFRVHKGGEEQISINEAGMQARQTPAASRTKSLADEFIMLEELGAGAGGTVYKALHATSLRFVAVKNIRLDDNVKTEQVYKELQGLMSNFVQLTKEGAADAPCPYLVAFYGAKTSSGKRTVSLILEYMDGGDLEDVLKTASKKRLDEKLIAHLAFGMARGLDFIHRRHSVHRDVKPGNVLVHTNGTIKIADFGIAKALDSTLSMAETFTGTRIYMSPERLEGKAYTYAADVWSVGLTVLALATGSNPLRTAGFWELREIISKGELGLTTKDGRSAELCDFVNSCLNLDPDQRPTCGQLMEHSFIKKNMSSRSRRDPSSKLVHKFLSKKARANAPSSTSVSKICQRVATFYLDHGLTFPSKPTLKIFAEQCQMRYTEIKKLINEAWTRARSK